MTTVAGGGSAPVFTNDIPAMQATFQSLQGVRAGSDGSFYISDACAYGNGGAIRRVGTDGIIRLFAGGGSGPGRRRPAAPVATLTSGSGDLAIGPDGSVFFYDGAFTVRRVDPSGIISTVIGQPGNSNFGGDNGPAALGTFGGSNGLQVGPDGTLYLAASQDHRVRRVQEGRKS
jgi:hypothetical protein